MIRRLSSTALAALLLLPGTASAQTAKRPFALDDLAKFKSVADPQISPDGAWIAYTVGSADIEKDKRDSDVWMVSWDGTRTVQLTSSKDSESRPRWSPDGNTSRSRRRAATRTKRRRAPRSGCSIAAAARPRSSPTSRAASTTTSGRPTARAWCWW